MQPEASLDGNVKTQDPVGLRVDADLSCNSRVRATTIRKARLSDRETIYRLRHEVFARELGQHQVNSTGRLTDSLDAFNTYFLASEQDNIVGFISVTPPGGASYSIDKYWKREEMPFAFDGTLYEMRLLAVLQPARRSLLALALMYAGFLWAESQGGTHLMAIGRREVLSMYFKVGLKLAGRTVQSGAVTFDLLHASMEEVHQALRSIRGLFDRIQMTMCWDVGLPLRIPDPLPEKG